MSSFEHSAVLQLYFLSLSLFLSTDHTLIQSETFLLQSTFYRRMRGFYRTFATGMACQEGTLTPPDTWSSPIWNLHMFNLLRPILFPNLYFFRIIHFEDSSVLFRICSLSILPLRKTGLRRFSILPLICSGPGMSTVVLYCWCHSDSASVFFVFYNNGGLSMLDFLVLFSRNTVCLVL